MDTLRKEEIFVPEKVFCTRVQDQKEAKFLHKVFVDATQEFVDDGKICVTVHCFIGGELNVESFKKVCEVRENEVCFIMIYQNVEVTKNFTQNMGEFKKICYGNLKNKRSKKIVGFFKGFIRLLLTTAKIVSPMLPINVVPVLDIASKILEEKELKATPLPSPSFEKKRQVEKRDYVVKKEERKHSSVESDDKEDKDEEQVTRERSRSLLEEVEDIKEDLEYFGTNGKEFFRSIISEKNIKP